MNPDLNVALQADLLPFDQRWEFPVDRLNLGKQLGAGAFGSVVQAEALGIVESEIRTTVAVKTANDTTDEAQLKALISELKILSHLGTHINTVNLLGACTKQLVTRRRLYIILEFCKYGNLRTYLQRHKDRFLDQTVADVDSTSTTSSNSVMTINEGPATLRTNPSLSSANFLREIEMQQEQTLKTSDLVCWAFQIARGMEFLSYKRILHGDLALRNILLAENHVVKICDFGLSRKLQRNYYYNYKKETDGALLPFKWMAIESIKCGLFSTASDCWSFGVVLWELFTLGDTPYPGFSGGQDIYNYLSKGDRMEKPSYAPSRIYDIMLLCWLENPAARPSFTHLVENLQVMMKDPLKDYYFQLETEHYNWSRHRQSRETDFFLHIGSTKIILDSDHSEGNQGYLVANASDLVENIAKRI